MNRCIVAFLLVLAACASPEQKAQKARDSVASWKAAEAMAAAEWRRGAVTDAYVRSTARVAIEELQKLDAPSRDETIRAWRALAHAAGQKP